MSLYSLVYLKLYKKLPLKVRVFARDIYFILKYGTRDMFVTIGIDLTSKCNLKCKYCPNYHLGGKGDNRMSMQLFRKIVSELKNINYQGNFSVPALYAEPLLDNRLISRLHYVHENVPRAKIIVFTNATRLTVSKYIELLNAGVGRLIVTGHNESGRNNIALLKDWMNGRNDEGIIEFINLDMNNLTTRGGTVPLDSVKVLESCIDPSRYLSITYDGKVLLCCHDLFEGNVMGDLNSNSLMSIWRGSAYSKLRSDIRQGIFNLEMCKGCGYGRLPERLRK